MSGCNVHTSLNFLQRLNVYKTVKPYSIDTKIRSWTGDVPRSNFRKDRVDNVLIQDMRGREGDFTFEKNGFAVIEMQSDLTYKDYENPEKVIAVYFKELASCLFEYFGATSVQIFDSIVRRRHPDFPNVQVDRPGQATQPASRVHIDATTEALDALVCQIAEDWAASRRGRYIYLNVWKPLRGPLYDWPLALCDAATIDAEDLEPHDHVFADVARENMMMYHNKNQAWYYLSGHMPSELLLFRQADSENRQGVPHTGFELPAQLEDQRGPVFPRESIEARVLVYLP